MKDEKRTYFKKLVDLPELKMLVDEPIFYHTTKCWCESYKSIGGKMSKPKLKLIGEDGNVFFVLGKAVREARRAGWDEERIEKFKSDAMSGDYDHVLQLCMEYFEVS